MVTRIVHLPRRIALVLALGLAFGIAACSSSSAILSTVGSSIDSQSGGGRAGPGAEQPAPAASAAPAAVGSDAAGPELNDINIASLLIIKTGTMDLQVAGLDAALSGASQKITALGGYASGSSRQGDGDSATAQITYRIPSARWDDALVALRGLASKVLGEQSQSQDVTGQVVDISARITNLQATEQALQAIMLKATKISDVLAVQQQLTDVRGQIEQLTGERKHLQEQAAYSTLTVNFSLKAQPVVETTAKKFDPGTEVDQASASLIEVLQGVATAGIWFGIVWLPILLALLVISAIVAVVVRRALRIRPGDPGEPGGPAAIDAPPAEAT